MIKFKAIAVICCSFLLAAFVGLVGCADKAKETTPPAADESWQGNWTRPDAPDESEFPEEHECIHSCYTCGKCLSLDCKEEVCAEKCYEPNGRTHYTFSGLDDKVIKKGGVSINQDGYLGNISTNANTEVIFYVKAEEKTTVCLGVTISEMRTDNVVTGCTPIFINGEQIFSRGYLKAGATTWTNFYTVWLGCFELEEGVNTIKFTNNGTNTSYNLKDFQFLSDVELKLVTEDGEEGPIDPITGTEYRFEGEDATLAPGDRNNITVNEDENASGGKYLGNVSTNHGATISYTLYSDKACDAGLYVSFGAPNLVSGIATLTVNGSNVRIVPASFECTGWNNYIEFWFTNLSLVKGINEIVITVTGGLGNFDYMSLQCANDAVIELVKSFSVTGVELTAEGGATSVPKGETLQLTATVKPSYAENKKVTFSSDNETVATVDQNGLVTAIEGGTVKITATSEDGGFTDEITLTVTIPVTGVSLASAGGVTEIPEGETLQLTATVAPDNATNKQVTYSSSDKGVAVVDETGLVTAVSVGEATITVTTVDGAKTDEITITVAEKPDKIPVTGVTLATENGETTFKKGQTLRLVATVAPENASNKFVTYSSSNQAVATVADNGVVTAVDGGTVTITVTTVDGNFSAEIELTVTVDAESIEVAATSARTTGIMLVNDTISLNASVLPANTSNKDVTWKATLGGSEVQGVISGSGETISFTPNAAGEWLIAATADDGSEVFGAYTAYVYENSLELDYTYARISGATLNYNVNESCVGSLNTAGSDTITFIINSETAQAASFEFIFAVTSDKAFHEFFTVTLNDGDIDGLNDKVYSEGSYGWANQGIAAMYNVQLKAGENVFEFVWAGANSNAFGLNAYGKGLTCEQVYVTPVTGADHKLEGEDASLTPGTGNITINEYEGASGGKYLGGVSNNYNAQIAYDVDVSKSCVAGLYISFGVASTNVRSVATLQINGESVWVVPIQFNMSNRGWTNFEEFWFANVNLNEGVNEIVITVTGGLGNVDYINLKCEEDVTMSQVRVIKEINVNVSKELLKPGESVDLDITVSGSGNKFLFTSSNTGVATVDGNGKITAVADGKTTITVQGDDELKVSKQVNIFVKSGTGTVYEAENARLEGCNIETSDGNWVGGLNNAGAKATFTVSSQSGGKVLLRIYTSVADGNLNYPTINNFYTVKINGNDVDLSEGQFGFNGKKGWRIEGGYFTVEVDLNAGENTVELISTGGSTCLDKIEIYE